MINASLSIDKITVVSRDERACGQIRKAAERMGIECHITDSVDNTKTDLLLIDVQHYFSDMHTQKAIPQALPIVGLIAHGSPTEIERAIAMGAMSVVGKPIHQTGLYAAFHMALKLSQQQAKMHQELESLKMRHKLRPVVIQAVIGVMEKHQISESQAYELLRSYSMQRNVPVEQVCLELTQGNVAYERLRGEG